MAVETYKVIGKKVVKELVPPELLNAQLAGGWSLLPEEAKKKAAKPAGN
jgi:hypothetical protein